MSNYPFIPIVEINKLNPRFLNFKNLPEFYSGKKMFCRLFKNYSDLDGNFIEQFQTTGFDQRIFELSWHALFNSIGWVRNLDHNTPDFILQKNESYVCVEVTSANPSSRWDSDRVPKFITELNSDEDEEYLYKILPFRFGGSLIAKVNRGYNELPQCKDKPLIIAINGSWSHSAFSYPFAPVAEYLFGVNFAKPNNICESLFHPTIQVESFSYMGKTIQPFFKLQESKVISGILFSNTFSIAKFCRMGVQSGIILPKTKIIRTGTLYKKTKISADMSSFSYNLEDGIHTETWVEGVCLFINPNANNQIPESFSREFAVISMERSFLKLEIPDFFPTTSITQFFIES